MPRKYRYPAADPMTVKLSKDFAKGNDESFRETLRKLVLAYGVQKLMRDTGYNRVSLWRFLRGEQDIKLSDFIAILKALGIKVRFESESKLEMMLEFFEWRHRKESMDSVSEATETAQAVRKG